MQLSESLPYKNDSDTYTIKDEILSAYSIISSIQETSIDSSEIYLSFYPIAKNIRFVSSYLTINCLSGKSSKISDRARGDEQNHWKSLGRDNWYPWLWARGRLVEPYSNDKGWNYYFESLNNRRTAFEYKSTAINNIFFIYLASLKYVFTLNKEYTAIVNKYKESINWPNNTSILAIQIRRGDTCTNDTTVSFRKIYSLETYLETADNLIKKNNFSHVFISTDSKDEIDRIKLARPQWNIIYLPFDREKFYRSNGTAIDIEDKCRMEPERIPFVVDTAIADLYFISQCQGYVSTITSSEFSKLGLFLQFCTQEKITPYHNICNQEISLEDVIAL